MSRLIKRKELNRLIDYKEKGVLVRYFNKPRIDQYLRISIGTDEEMDKVVEELKKIVNH